MILHGKEALYISRDLFTEDMEDLRGMEPVNDTVPEEPITKPQLVKLKFLGKDLGLSKVEAVKLLKEYGAANTHELTKKQAIELIQKLLSMKEAS